MQIFGGKTIKDIESAVETPIPYINHNLKGRNITKSSSTGAISQMIESECFDSYIDKKNKELI